MDSLPVGTYKFIQKREVCDKKSMLFVKLTDSALRALNDYLKEPSQLGRTPTIEFIEDSRGGLIEIPKSSRGFSKTEACPIQFKFNLESNVAMQGRQGRFECIKRREGSKRIRKYGLLTKRLKIHANDDVFETTKNRMAEVELEQRKICTKEIDLKLETVNRLVKIEKNSKLRTPLSTSTPETASIKVGPHKFTRTRNKNLNISSKLNSPIARRPLKERIVHMLAVRPLKKIELSATLRRGKYERMPLINMNEDFCKEDVHRETFSSFSYPKDVIFILTDVTQKIIDDGLRESDKNLLNSTLMSVATVKDNVYHLLRYMWNDVQEDWPFYSEEEREKMLGNKECNLLLIINGLSTSSNLSPKNLSLGDMSPSRPGYIKGVDGLPTKRKRISHFSRPNFTPIRLCAGDNESVHQISPSRVTNGFDDIIEKFGLSNSTSKSSPLKFNSKLCSKLIKSEQSMICDDDMDVGSSVNWNECDKPDINTQSAVIMNEQCDSGISDKTDTSQFSLSDGPDFTEIYVTITNTEQRRRYKNDFIEYYKEYMVVNNEVLPVTSEFIQLQKKYRQYEKGSPEYVEIEKQIVDKYYETMNTDYNTKKERHNYLHNLLSHIKKLVYDYDGKMI